LQSLEEDRLRESPQTQKAEGFLAEDDVLFFLHIPKTGGLSLISLLDAEYEFDEILPLHSAPSPELFEIYDIEQLKKFRFIRGHFSFGALDSRIYQHIVQNPISITLLREPVSRLISNYRHFIRNPKLEVHPHEIFVGEYTADELQVDTEQMRLYREAKDISLMEFICDPRFFRTVYNQQTRLILGAIRGFPQSLDDPSALSEETLLQLAKDRLKQFAFIGLTERFWESLQLLTYTFRREPFQEIPRLNVSPEIELEPIPKATLEAFMERNRLDDELYRFAERLFEERWSQMVIDLLNEKQSLGKRGITEARFNEMEATISEQQGKIEEYHSLEKELHTLSEKVEIINQEAEIAKQEAESAKQDVERAKQEIKTSQKDLSIAQRHLKDSETELQKTQYQLHLEGTKHSEAAGKLQEMMTRFTDLRTSAEGRVLLAWMVRKEIILPRGSLRRRAFDRILLFPLSIRLSLIRFFQRLANMRGIKQIAIRVRGEKLSPLEREKYGSLHGIAEPEYSAFVRQFEPRPKDIRNQERAVDSWPFKPKIGLVTVVVDATKPILDQTVSSLLNQSYEHWVWYLVDASAQPEISRYLQDLAVKEPRVRYLIGKPEGDISASRRLGLRQVEGGYITFLSARDTLAPNALYTVADLVRQNSEIDLIYSDHDQLDELGYRNKPFFKPDWSPELLLSTDYLAPFCVFKRNLIEKLDDQKMSLQGPGIWDFHLRLSELSNNIQHVPAILCHERGESIFSSSDSEILVTSQDMESVLRDHLVRSGLGEVEVSVEAITSTKAQWDSSKERRISIIIPSRDKPQLVGACLRGLFEATDYSNFQVVLVDTGSVDDATLALYEKFSSNPQFKLVHFQESFNFSKACNFGASHADGELILFLNNDTEVIESEWLRSMSQWFDRDGVGIVGAQLLYPDGTLQHSGVVVGFGGVASHLFEGQEEDVETIFGRARWYRNLSAVTAACMLVSREAYEAVNGFDEDYQLNYSDVDLCIKIRKAGWRIVFTPDARLIHHESRSHGRRIPRMDFERASQRLFEAGFLQGDPYFNPNLSYMSTYPMFRRSHQDNPLDLNRRLMSRLPHKEFLQLPDDLR
jgi:GT2 family glycosyltransferase